MGRSRNFIGNAEVKINAHASSLTDFNAFGEFIESRVVSTHSEIARVNFYIFNLLLFCAYLFLAMYWGNYLTRICFTC